VSCGSRRYLPAHFRVREAATLVGEGWQESEKSAKPSSGFDSGRRLLRGFPRVHRRSLRLERRGLRSRSLFASSGRGPCEGPPWGTPCSLSLYLPMSRVDIVSALPAAHLHDHLERYTLFLEALGRVSAGAVLDEVAETRLVELVAENLCGRLTISGQSQESVRSAIGTSSNAPALALGRRTNARRCGGNHDRTNFSREQRKRCSFECSLCVRIGEQFRSPDRPTPARDR